jgi:hypothetical protein
MTRHELKDYKYTQEWIKDRFEYIEELKTNVLNISSVISDMPRAGREVEDSMAEKLAKLLDSIDDLLARIVLEDEKQKAILRQLEEVEMPYKLILEKIYIQGKTLVTVASEMPYDYKYMCKMHGIALNKFDEHDKKGRITI